MLTHGESIELYQRYNTKHLLTFVALLMTPFISGHTTKHTIKVNSTLLLHHDVGHLPGVPEFKSFKYLFLDNLHS